MKFEELDRMVRDLDCFIYPEIKNNTIKIYFNNGKLPKPLHIITFKNKKSVVILINIKHKKIIPDKHFEKLTNLIFNYWKAKED